MNIKNWISAFRFRTLPLAVSSILMGIASAQVFGHIDYAINTWAIITTVLLQILSNLANDYGDGVKGTDNDRRLGPERAIQSGKISPKQMKNAIALFSVLSFFSGIYLLSISNISFEQIIVFVLLGISAIIAAIKYTVGNKAYGYHGLGDIFVFLFFGLVAVLGTSFLIIGGFNFYALLPASAIGLLSTAVLNLNNMRDIENDKKMGKLTIPVKLGIHRAKIYHTFLVNIAFLFLLLFCIITNVEWYVYLSFFLYLLFFIDLVKIDKIKELNQLDPFLKKTAIKTFLFTITLTTLVFL